jgi:hypothetical protein
VLRRSVFRLNKLNITQFWLCITDSEASRQGKIQEHDTSSDSQGGESAFYHPDQWMVPGERYFVYQSSGGLSNQRASLFNLLSYHFAFSFWCVPLRRYEVSHSWLQDSIFPFFSFLVCCAVEVTREFKKRTNSFRGRSRPTCIFPFSRVEAIPKCQSPKSWLKLQEAMWQWALP